MSTETPPAHPSAEPAEHLKRLRRDKAVASREKRQT
jgi:hypothetical protein